MEEIDNEERNQAGDLQTKFNSFSPEEIPLKHFAKYGLKQVLPCHYFDIICGGGTARYVFKNNQLKC